MSAAWPENHAAKRLLPRFPADEMSQQVHRRMTRLNQLEQSRERQEVAQLRQMKENQQREVQRYMRMLKCTFVLMVYWFGMIYLITHHDKVMALMGFVVLGVWSIFMCFCIFGNWAMLRVEENLMAVPEDAENAGLTRGNYDMTNQTSTSSTTVEDGVFPYEFEDTPVRIRDCVETIAPGYGPTSGTYDAIFSAVFFNKVLRTEGVLRLEFVSSHENGWAIKGDSTFGKNCRGFRDGFVNARGEMYWTTGDALYRGVMDFNSSTMYDGEFSPTSKKAPNGRIVRLELRRGGGGAPQGERSLEMVDLSRKQEEEDDDDNRPLT